MNRFRKGKKTAKDDLAAPPRTSGESESSSPFKMFGKKKLQEETKEEIDLTAALPPSDDFRTSLLMTGLSARFSMLREQDDPNTKVGKASDDSVLFPKRQSRLMDFGFSGGLGDIAEVESIRAPFARDSSYNSDDGSSISGSIMSRAKPTEGNNLFGGRQKIYKIAANGGATSGRALYDHDVAQSAFQKWRQSEKDGEAPEDQQSDSFDLEPTRPDSPQSDYNRRRETSSTTSSGPSVGARNSTAATSITSSQPSASIKEWQNAAAAAAANPTPPLERSFTRSRRLYEQGLNQEMHNQQTSALSRIDTLSKQRNFTNRTPELTPSPASATFGERFSNSRSVLTKASAPNLRSFSPPTTISSQASPLEPQNKFPGLEERVAFGATPPLSPPISETGETQSRSFIAADKSKIASMSVLAKAAMYDESTYAQRQIQLQQGRETPTMRFRNESSISVGTVRSRSRSPSVHRGSSEKHDSNASMKAPVGLRPEGHVSTFFDDEDDMLENIPIRAGIPRPPQVTVERPADNEHPAFRKPAVPAPLTIDDSQDHESPEDSPTLGPRSGGLSGMVRAHLRHDSNASSVYGSVPNESDLASRFPPERDDVQIYEPLTTKPSTWESIEQGVAMSMDTDLPSPTRSRSSIDPQDRTAAAPPSAHDSKIDLQQENEPDDFARHLADGARRVRERLTSYVESDSGSIAPAAPPLSELPPPPRVNALGILKTKSSRGSLVDKTRSEQGQTKAKKLLGLGSTTQSPGPYTPRPESAQADYDAKQEQQAQFRQSEDGFEAANDGSSDGVHAGLKAFRQARRELQKMKEMEVQQRYQGPPSRERAPSLRGPDSRQASRERRAPPVSFNRMGSDDLRNGGSSRSNSRGPSYRDRSGSENSNNDGRSGSRARSGSIRDEIQPTMGSPGSSGVPRQGGMMHANQGRNASPARFNQFGEPPALSYDQVQQMTRPRDPSDPPMMPAGGLAGLRGPIPSPLAAPTAAPPLPPINPRRKTNTMNEQRFPVSPMSADEGRVAGGFPMSDDETAAEYRQRLRKATSEANGMNARAHSLRNSPPHPRGPPPMPPGMARGGLPGGMI